MLDRQHMQIMLSPATSENELVRRWLHRKSPHTQRAYLRDIQKFMLYVNKSLPEVTLADLQDFDLYLEEEALNEKTGEPLAVTSRARILAAVKSLLTFAQKTGYLVLNVGTALELPKYEETLAERILSEGQVQKMFALENNPRNLAILYLLYYGALRASELVYLEKRHLKEHAKGGQITVFGKESKTGAVLIPAEKWQFINDALDTASKKTRDKIVKLETNQIRRIVEAAAVRAGIDLYEKQEKVNGKEVTVTHSRVSPHWLRHSHASHALDRNAPISLVKETLRHSNVATTSKYLHARPNDSSSMYLPN